MAIVFYLFFCRTNCAYFNESIGKRKFLNCLKLADFTPLFKKGAHTPKKQLQTSEDTSSTFYI